MKRLLQCLLNAAGDPGPILSAEAVGGGSIGRSFRAVTGRREYFIKYHEDLPETVFVREAEGLELLRQIRSLPVPEVYYCGGVPEHKGSAIVMEWIHGEPNAETAEQLGRGLARLHLAPASQFGLSTDNYIGELPQPNGWYGRWPEFLRERRLAPMAQLAERKGLLPESRRVRLARLLDSLDRWVPADSRPSLLHGDLWSGNWIVGRGGQPYLIDPAVFYGDREFDLAFTELFGGFPARFYAAYRGLAPLSREYEDRRPIYQLYYLLVHLILFGESYGPAIDRILRRYAG